MISKTEKMQGCKKYARWNLFEKKASFPASPSKNSEYARKDTCSKKKRFAGKIGPLFANLPLRWKISRRKLLAISTRRQRKNGWTGIMASSLLLLTMETLFSASKAELLLPCRLRQSNRAALLLAWCCLLVSKQAAKGRFPFF